MDDGRGEGHGTGRWGADLGPAGRVWILLQVGGKTLEGVIQECVLILDSVLKTPPGCPLESGQVGG